MTDPSVQTALSIGVPTLAVLFGILIHNNRLSDLRTHMDARFDGMREMWRGETSPCGRSDRRAAEAFRGTMTALMFALSCCLACSSGLTYRCYLSLLFRGSPFFQGN